MDPRGKTIIPLSVAVDAFAIMYTRVNTRTIAILRPVRTCYVQFVLFTRDPSRRTLNERYSPFPRQTYRMCQFHTLALVDARARRIPSARGENRIKQSRALVCRRHGCRSTGRQVDRQAGRQASRQVGRYRYLHVAECVKLFNLISNRRGGAAFIFHAKRNRFRTSCVRPDEVM